MCDDDLQVVELHAGLPSGTTQAVEQLLFIWAGLPCRVPGY